MVPFLSDQYLRGKTPAVDLKKVEIIYQISRSQFYIFVPKSSPYKSVADLKKSGKAFKFASTGIGAITWVQAMALGGTVGFPVKFVLGYKKLGDASCRAGCDRDAASRAVIGIVFGALPGLGSNVALSIVLPFTLGMDPSLAMCLLGGSIIPPI